MTQGRRQAIQNQESAIQVRAQEEITAYGTFELAVGELLDNRNAKPWHNSMN